MSKRIFKSIGLVTVVAAFTASAASAKWLAEDAGGGPTTSSQYASMPDAVSRYLTGHAQSVVVDGRSPDTQDFAIQAHSAVPAQIVTVGSTRFDWTDAGIGAGSAFGFALLAALGLATVKRNRQTVALP